MEFLYRFRSVDALIGERAELRNQEIYFASPAQLNDPMEGFKNIFWKGDRIIWKNLFKHYMRTLVHTTYTVMIFGKEYKSNLADNLISHNESTFSGAPINELTNEIYEECFRDSTVNRLIN
jgi:hypothetical protein